MNYFESLELKPLSLEILHYINAHEEQQAKDIASALGYGTRQVDAAISKSLQRYSLAIRYAKLTPLKKKAYNVIRITDIGRSYMNYIHGKKGE